MIITAWATTTSDGSDGKAPKSVHVAEVHQLQAAFRRAQATPRYVVPQGKVGYGHRGMSCGRTTGPAPGRSAVARRG